MKSSQKNVANINDQRTILEATKEKAPNADGIA